MRESPQGHALIKAVKPVTHPSAFSSTPGDSGAQNIKLGTTSIGFRHTLEELAQKEKMCECPSYVHESLRRLVQNEICHRRQDEQEVTN